MNENDALRSAAGVLRRQWWIVAVAVAVAAVAGLAMGRAQGTKYEGTATLLVDYPATTRYKGVPQVDDILRQSSSSRMRERLARHAGIEVSKMAGGLRVSSTGNPPNRVVVTFVSSDKREARAVAESVADEIVSYARERTKVEIDGRESLILNARESEDRIEKLVAKGGLTPDQQADNEFKLWMIRKDGIEANTLAKVLSSVYSLEGESSVAERAAASGLGGQMAGSLLVGAVLGLLIAAVREVLAVRGASGKDA